MLGYIYTEKPLYITYDEKEGIKVSKCPCEEKKSVSSEKLIAGIDLKLVLYFLVLILVLKLLKIL